MMKLSFAFTAASMVAAVQAQALDPMPDSNPVPSTVGIDIDGSITDWSTNDAAIPMYLDGDATKDFAANLYIRSDCSSETLCMLVLAKDKRMVAPDRATSFFKDFKIGEEAMETPAFEFVKDGADTVGFEACYATSMDNVRDQILISTSYDGGKIATTLSTASIDLDCDNDYDFEFEEELDLGSRTAGVTDPCAEVEEPEGECLAGGAVCTNEPEKCCGNMDCTGYNFYKTCKETPVCLPAWHDCSNGIDCCDEMVCARTDNGLLECQTEKIGTRTVSITAGLVDEEPEPVVEEKDLRTANIVGDGNLVGACISGDPHIHTFDDVVYDCQGIGEFTLFKSQNTGRLIQSRFKQVNDRAVSVQRGLLIQDEGNTPKIQIHVREADGPAEPFGPSNCALQFHVDGEQFSLYNGDKQYSSDDVEITLTDSKIKFVYTASKMEAHVTIRGGDRCALGLCLYYPENDDTVVGMLGTPDDDDANDWMTPTGEVVTTPKARRGEVPHSYCTQNWCMKDAAMSKFTYNEEGFSFDDFENCDFPEGSMMEQEIESSLTQAQANECAGNIMCMEEMAAFGELGARGVTLDMDARKTKLKKKVKDGRSCDKDSDCKSGNCVKNGWAGEKCRPAGYDVLKDLNPMTEKKGLCNDKVGDGALPCGEGLECQMRNDEWGSCYKLGACGKRNTICATDDDCCDTCMEAETKEDGTVVKRCKKVKNTKSGVRLELGEDCKRKKGPKCVDGAFCMDMGEEIFKCKPLPDVWTEKNRQCGEGMPGCSADAGLTCKKIGKKGNKNKAPEDKQFKFICKNRPTCAKKAGRCELDDGTELPCCEKDRVCEANRKGKKVCKKIRKEKATTEGEEPEKEVRTKTFNMYDNGETTGAIVAKARATVDCKKETLCIRVKATKQNKIKNGSDANWLKDYAVGALPAAPLNKKKGLVAVKNKAKEVVGWKGCFDVSGRAKSESIEVSAEWGADANGGGMASTGLQGKAIKLDFCD